MERATEAELAERLRKAGERVQVGARYAHYKNPDKPYLVKSVAILEATEEPAVVYEAEYGERITFVRALSSWLAPAEEGGREISRFRNL